MTTLFLIRHGETAANSESRFQGQQDVPLSERGREQSRALAQALAEPRLDAVYASDLCRAAETAALLAAPHGCRVQLDARWRELDVGEWRGFAVGEVARRWPELYARWLAGSDDLTMPGGESLTHLLDRVRAAFEELVAAHPAGRVAVVAHGVSLRAAIAHVLGVGPHVFARLRLANCAVTTVSLRPGQAPVLRGLNDERVAALDAQHASVESVF